MALLFFDGFDHLGNNGDPVARGKWGGNTTGNNGTANISTVRTGAASLVFNNTNYDIVSKPLPASGGFAVGVAVTAASMAVSGLDILQLREGTTVHLAVGLTTGALLQVKRGATVLATGTTALVANSWYYLEFKGVIHDTTGSYELRLDGLPELVNAGPLDTRNAGTTGQWDRIRLAPGGNTAYFFDDLYVCDLSGAAPYNDFLGPCKVETLLPQTGNGSNVGLTPSTGTDHGALVDEVGPNTTDYNSSPTVGAKDTYNYPSLALTGTVLGIQTNLYVAKSDTAARQVCAVVRTGGTDYDGANVAPATTFGYFTEVRALNPATGVAWTPADIAALEAGMKVTA